MEEVEKKSKGVRKLSLAKDRIAFISELIRRICHLRFVQVNENIDEELNECIKKLLTGLKSEDEILVVFVSIISVYDSVIPIAKKVLAGF